MLAALGQPLLPLSLLGAAHLRQHQTLAAWQVRPLAGLIALAEVHAVQRLAFALSN